MPARSAVSSALSWSAVSERKAVTLMAATWAPESDFTLSVDKREMCAPLRALTWAVLKRPSCVVLSAPN